MGQNREQSDMPFLQALSGKSIMPPPIWLMRQAGRYLPEYRAVRAGIRGFLDLCYTPDFAVEVTLQPLRRFTLDAAIVFSDILVVPDGLGQIVAFREGEGPVLQRIIETEDINILDIDRLVKHLQPVYDTVKRLRRELSPQTALIGFAGAPWTVATYMIEGGSSKDLVTAKTWAFGRTRDLGRLMEILVEATILHLIAQIDAGADAVQIFDTWSGVLPEHQFRQWVIEPTRQVVEAIQRQRPGVPIIGFPKGAGVLYEDFVAETGVNGVSLDSSVPLRWAAERLQPHVTVQGNLDPIMLVTGGSAMIDAAKHIVDILSKGPFIFNLGHGIVPSTPPEHVAELVSWVKALG